MRSFPAYPKKKHASGQARIRIGGHDHYLGIFGSDKSRVEYARLATLFATSPEAAPKKSDALTVSGLIERWHTDAKTWQRKHELYQCVRASIVLDRLYGSTAADSFRCPALEIVRKAMITGSWLTEEEKQEHVKRKRPIGWCKNQVLHMLTRTKRIFKFGESKGLLPVGMYEHFKTLEPIRGEVRKTKKRKPVEESVVTATLPHLSLMVASMVRVQLLTGMRPSELCKMQAGHFEAGPEGSWLYRLDSWKSDGTSEEEWQYVVMGPECQRIIAPWLDAARALGWDVFLWRPRPQRETPYTVSGYYQAVHDACIRAKVEPFFPYQIRHTCKRRITREHGSDAARAVLRQRTLDATQHYAAQQDVETAAKVQAQAG